MSQAWQKFGLALAFGSMILSFAPRAPAAVPEAYHKAWSDPAVVQRIDEGIERHRKGDAVIEAVDAEGRPVDGASLEIRQQTHKFLFGCNAFVLGQMPEDPAEIKQLYQKRFQEIAGRYARDIQIWDIVNESLSDRGKWPLFTPDRSQVPWAFNEAGPLFRPDNVLMINGFYGKYSVKVAAGPQKIPEEYWSKTLVPAVRGGAVAVFGATPGVPLPLEKYFDDPSFKVRHQQVDGLFERQFVTRRTQFIAPGDWSVKP